MKGKKTIQTETQQTEFEKKKQILHNLIDSLTPADYVSFSTNLENLTSETVQKLHKIIIEINGNIHVIPKRPSFFNDGDDDDFDDEDEDF